MSATSSSMPDWLQRRAELSPDQVGLIYGTDEWTFTELDHAANLVATLLDRLGLSGERGADQIPDLVSVASLEAAAGPRIALLLPNCPEFVVWAHALPRAGAVLLPLNTRLSTDELIWQLRDAGAHALVYHPHFSESVQEISNAFIGLRLIDVTETELRATERSERVVPAIHLDQVHGIVYTSGTTGRPKGAILTHGNHWWSATASLLNLGVGAHDSWLAAMPLFHVGGLAILLRSVIYGVPVVLHERFNPTAIDHDLRAGRATIISLVPTMLEQVLELAPETGYPTLRAVLLGGGPAPEPLLRRAAELELPVLQTYGLTEAASQVATLGSGDALRKIGSAGKPLFPNTIRIVTGTTDEAEKNGARVESQPLHEYPLAQPGEIGELLIKGPTITPGYWGREVETAAAIHDGWLRTGDLAYLDQDGFLYIVDRRSDMFISGGENVYPAEIEEALSSHSAVMAAGVVGVHDDRWGRVPAAAIITDLTWSSELEEELSHHCNSLLARYKVPRYFVQLDELPRNATGKLQRARLLSTLNTILSNTE